MKPDSLLGQLRSHLFLASACAIGLYMSWDVYAQAKEESRRAAEQLATCRLQASEIRQVRDQPAFAVTTIAQLDTITDRISRAGDIAGVDDQAINLVDPRAPRRIGDSAYRLRPVSIHLRGLLLSQAAKFSDALTDRPAGMWVTQIRMTPVRNQSSEQDPELWNVELILTQVNYSPTTR